MSLPSQYATYAVNRYCRGPIDTAALPAASGFQINPGDLCVYYSGSLYSVANGFGNVIAWNSGNEIQNWSGARAVFAGVAMGQQNSYSTVSGHVTCATTGVFEFPCNVTSGSSWNPGTYVSFSQDPLNGQVGSGLFASQAICQASGNSTAIGKVIEPLTVNTSGLGIAKVQMQSFLQYGGFGV